MIYLYDRAICDDLNNSFDPGDGSPAAVRVVEPENALGVIAQIKNDEITFPLVCLVREDYQIDNNRTNFTRLHKGVDAVLDTDTNNIYHEKATPITLSYNLHVMTTNTVDMDEMMRELTFKYSHMYFLSIQLPYEGTRKFRFGVCIDENSSIQHVSGVSEYIGEGKLYESVIPLRCEGCVMVTYTPQKLRRVEYEIDPQVTT